MRNQQSGFTLIELMIGMLVGLIVLSGVIYAFLSTIRSSSDVLNGARLNRELDSVADIMIGELRRAGYVSGASSSNSPFTNGLTKDVYLDPLYGTGMQCILYSYDQNMNGTLDYASEFKGFRYVSSAQTIEFRSSANASTADTSCSDSSGTWVQLNDSSAIGFSDSLEFNLIQTCWPSTASCASPAALDSEVSVRKVEISIEAFARRDTAIRSRIVEAVRIPNNIKYE